MSSFGHLYFSNLATFSLTAAYDVEESIPIQPELVTLRAGFLPLSVCEAKSAKKIKQAFSHE